ncbi:MAG: 2-C-methyl-D-erythritol 4-phosphate cytidylyltransferase [Candidatus Gastranaerophilales bacterium]|nr:2-C-methyl-D-erythritol 4-phosphate cytidylyltransferase [Candidatus Gastranaerophilales bacterium]MCM1072931.1 2-C-methyl-D-erythritol 4-phosphate cytidylyltransferase [Bacteroides sp.]
MTNFSVIITAGGTSSRYGNKNKLLELIDDKTVIEHTVSAFLGFEEVTEIIIPTNQSIKEEIQHLLTDSRIKIVEGGDTRQKSVFKGLQEVQNDYVIIHDGARPLVQEGVISQTMDLVKIKNAVSVMTKTTDTIKEVDENGRIIKTIDRSKLYNTQTPQAFKTSLIKEAHETLKDYNFTDDASMLEELNKDVYIIIGSYTNIKITTKSDLDFAKLYV